MWEALHRAVGNAMNNGRTFLMNKGYSEDVAISMMSVACDFGITQVSSLFLWSVSNARVNARLNDLRAVIVNAICKRNPSLSIHR